MFEVVLTMRSSFAEQVVARCATEQKAKTIAQRISAERSEGVLRVMVRRSREASSRE